MELCELCHVNTATIHLTQMSQGETITRHLCSDCANDEGIPLLEEELTDDADSFDQESVLLCPRCNRSEEEITSSGMVGCAECYKTFRTVLHEQQSYDSQYRRFEGKQYRQTASRSFQTELDTLRRELGTAIREERFELATVVRDRIRHLEDLGEASWS